MNLLKMDKKMKPEDANDLSLKEFIKNFTQDAFHVDKRIITTLHTLFIKPGQLTIEYFKNSEKKHIQPLKLYYAINFIFFLLTPLLNTPNFQVFNFNMKSIIGRNHIYQEIIKEQVNAMDVSAVIYEERFNAHLKYNQPAFVFLIFPLFALLVTMLNFKKERYYLKHLIFSVHFLSFYLLFLLLIIFLYRILAFGLKCFALSNTIVGIILFVAIIIGPTIYLAVATRNFYKNNTLQSIIKALILSTGFLVSVGVYVQFLFFYTILALKLGY
jgi:hypothetical protein